METEKIKVINEIRELLYMWDLKGIAKENLDGYERGVVLELIENCAKLTEK